jgi:hypothetical protein
LSITRVSDRTYVGGFRFVAAISDIIWELQSGPSNQRFQLHEFALSSTDTGISARGLELRRGTTAGTGTAQTEARLDPDTAVGDCVFITKPTALTGDVIWQGYWRMRFDYLYRPMPEERIIVDDSSNLQLWTNGIVSTYAGWVVWEEL